VPASVSRASSHQSLDGTTTNKDNNNNTDNNNSNNNITTATTQHPHTHQHSQQLQGFSKLLVIITGKGPMKAQFEEKIRSLTQQGWLSRFVTVRTAWLEP